MKKSALILFVSLYVCVSWAQIKTPIYTLGVNKQNCYDSLIEFDNIVFQFFADSTFTLTQYIVQGRYDYNIRSLTTEGEYLIKGDTLILNDSSSRFFPFVQEKNYFPLLGKDNQLSLFPAKVILNKDESQYISYLNRPKNIKLLDKCYIKKLESIYERKTKENLDINNMRIRY